MSRLPHEGSMIGVQCQLVICRGHIRASQGTFQIFLRLTVLHFRSILKGSLMGLEVKNLLSCQSKHGLVGSSAKTRNFLSRELQE